MDYKVNHTITDADGKEIPVSIPFTGRVEPAVVEIYKWYTRRSLICDVKLEIMRPQEVGPDWYTKRIEMGMCAITDFNLVDMKDGTVAETVTRTADKYYEASSAFGPAFSPGSTVLVCVGAAVVIGAGVFFLVRKKEKY